MVLSVSIRQKKWRMVGTETWFAKAGSKLVCLSKLWAYTAKNIPMMIFIMASWTLLSSTRKGSSSDLSPFPATHKVSHAGKRSLERKYTL